MSSRIESLVDAVAVLALNPEKQLEYLQEIGLPDGVDELALGYDAIAAAADDMVRLQELDLIQCKEIKKLNRMLQDMSGRDNAMLWTNEALFTADEWKDVRHLAEECLRLLKL